MSAERNALTIKSPCIPAFDTLEIYPLRKTCVTVMTIILALKEPGM